MAACREMFWAYFFGYMPIWVTFLLQFLVRGPSHFGEFFQGDIDSGSVFLVSAAMFSSYIYILMNDEGVEERGPFPHRSTFVLIFFGITIAWALVIGLQTLSTNNKLDIHLDPDAMRWLTYVSTIVALLNLYLLFVYRNATTPGYAKLSRDETKQFSEDWRHRNG